ncbi:hypothetical protein GN958_ATG04623 [Phytophthora infestans]|uniref:Uncharacterized protein n=1 Tax=Phytophthora infestans TaxID=4787 RepID=A0A8S9V6K6_PHYIN|nr:hypothetical protein GN958_ATG04623 [Phytophthora infestans]
MTSSTTWPASSNKEWYFYDVSSTRRRTAGGQPTPTAPTASREQLDHQNVGYPNTSKKTRTARKTSTSHATTM